MEITCQNCNCHFDSPLSRVGKIQYTQSNNVVRMEYGAKVPCPSCREILKVVPDHEGFVGHPINHFSDKTRRPTAYEPTVEYQPDAHSVSVKFDPDRTVVRAQALPRAPEISVKQRMENFSLRLKPQAMAAIGACFLF